jgi:hypothetical protein
MQKVSLLLIVVGGILSACIAYESSSRRSIGLDSEHGASAWRSAVGSYCPPRQAMKGYC